MLLLLLACRQTPCTTQSGYLDLDGDGFGSAAFDSCDAQDSLVERGGDCDDDDAAVHPDAFDLCDGIDLNCDGQVQTLNWWVDTDQDGFGAGESIMDCEQPLGYSATPGDCDDADPSAWPGAPETWYDDVDQDCDGGDDWDQDGDGSPYPSDCDDTDPSRAPTLYEVCETGVDEDCNGLVDEDCQFFGGVASGDAYLQINGLKASEWGEHQFTGDTVLALPDVDGDGNDDFGLCSSTEYNGGFHVFGSTSAGGEFDLKSARVSLDESCTNRSQVPQYLPDGSTEGIGVLSFGAILYGIDSLDSGSLVEGYGNSAVVALVDFDEDTVLDLLYKTDRRDQSLYGIPGPLVGLGSERDWRQDALWTYNGGFVQVVVADVLDYGSQQAIVLQSTVDRVVEVFVADPALLSIGLSTFSGGLHVDLSGSFSVADTLIVRPDLDGNGTTEIAIVGDENSGQSLVLLLEVGYAESGEPQLTIVGQVMFGSERYPADPSSDVAFGDFNGDGNVDVAWSEHPDTNGGIVYVILGPLEGTYTSDDAHGWITRGQAAYDTCDEADTSSCEHYGAAFGSAIATLDHNGDGIDDLLIGAPFYETESPKHGPGAVFLFLGAEGSPW